MTFPNPKYPNGCDLYVSIDIETTDLDETKGQILEVAAICDDFQSPFDELPKFHVILNQRLITGGPTALSINADLIRAISELEICRYKQLSAYEGDNVSEKTRERLIRGVTQFIEPDQLDKKMKSWFQTLPKANAPKIAPAGKNFGGFDKIWLQKVGGFICHKWMIHRSLDPAMLYMDPKIDAVPPGLRTCLERACLTIDNAHNAVDDAWAVCQLLRYGF